MGDKKISEDAVIETGRLIKVNGKKIKRREEIDNSGIREKDKKKKKRVLERNEALHVLWYFDPGEEDAFAYKPNSKEIAQVAHEEWPEDRFFWPSKMMGWVNKYWPRSLPEKTFAISFQKADKMILKSKPGAGQQKALALVVSNIESPEKVDAIWQPFNKKHWKHKENVQERNTKNPIRVYRLDPHYFQAWTEQEVIDFKKNQTLPQRQEAYTVFKGYIEHTFDNEELGDKDYKDLFLVGRIIDIGKGDNRNLGVVILVAVKDSKTGGWDFQIQPWTTHGPTGAGGGGAMP